MTQLSSPDAAKYNCFNDVTVSKLIMGFIKEHKGLFVIYLLFLLIVPLQDVGLPHLLGKLLKALQKKEKMTLILIMIVVVLLLLQAGYMLADYVEIKMVPLLVKYVRNTILQHIFDTHNNNLETLLVGDITTKLVRLPLALYKYIDNLKNNFVPQIFVFIVVSIYISFYSVVLGISFFVLVIIMLVGFFKSVNVCGRIAKEKNRVYSYMHDEIDDVLRNITTVLNYDTRNQEMDRLDIIHNQFAELTEKTLRCSLSIRYVLVPLILLYLVFFIFYSYRLLKNNKIKVFTFVPLFVVVLYASNTMWKMLDRIRDLVFKWGLLQESLELFKKCVLKDNVDAAVTHNIVPGGVDGKHAIITFQNVSYDYDGSSNVLNTINLQFYKGERTLLVGQIGSGKSTILKLIMKYHEPSSGRLLFDGVPYANLSTSFIRSKIGYIPQTPILLNRTLYENIAYGNSSDLHVTKDKVWKLMEEFNLLGVFSNLPDGLDTNVGKDGSKLSGGQRQIVWILRLLIQQPEVILMDEPTSAVDNRTKTILQKLISTALMNKTVIMVTHDENLKKFADRVIDISDGNIINGGA